MAEADQARSRFWKGDDSSDEEEHGSTSSSEDEQEVQKKKATTSRWEVDSDDESFDDDDKTRVVKSADAKTTESVAKVFKALKHYVSIKDWNKVDEEYKNLLKEGSKARKANKIDSNTHIPVFLHAIKFLNGAIVEVFANKPLLKKLSKTNNKSFNHLRARVSKFFDELGDQLENLADNADGVDDNENASDSESDSSESEDNSSESGDDSSDSGSSSDSEHDASESDNEWSSDSSESESSDDELAGLTGRSKWVKRIKSKAEERGEKEETERKARQRDADKRARAELKKESERIAAERKAADKPSQASAAKALTPNQIKEQFMILISQRGRKGANKQDIATKMRKLAYMLVAQGPIKAIPSLMNLISTQFDIRSGIDDYMSASSWRAVMLDVRVVLKFLQENPKLRLGHLESDELGAMSVHAQDKESHAKDGATGDEINQEDDIIEIDGDLTIIRVVGEIGVFVERLAEDYTKCLRFTEQHAQEYVYRLADEGDLVDLAMQTLQYYAYVEDSVNAAKMCLLCIEFTYYKHDSITLALLREQALMHQYGKREFFHPACTGAPDTKDGIATAQNFSISHPAAASGSPSFLAGQLELNFDPIDKMKEWCTFMYQYGDARGKFRAVICQISHYATHDEFFKARDLLLMSRLQDQIHTVEIDTQILYNRMMVHLGLAAFRADLMQESHSCLVEICGNNKEKELLAQGINWRTNRTPDQEKVEKRRLMPYHQHINLELLNAVYLTSAMLLEIPFMASMEFENQNVSISRNFRRQLHTYSEMFSGPPENTKDHILAAALAMQRGGWATATDLVLNLNVWKLFQNSAGVKIILAKRIKEESLRTYMMSFSAHYDSIKQEFLSEMFGMEPAHVHAAVSKMILNNEIVARWDQPTASVVLHLREPTHVQALALQFADRLSMVLEGNERAINSSNVEERGSRNRRDREAGKPGNYRDTGRGGKGAGRSGHRNDNRGGLRMFGPGTDSNFMSYSRKSKPPYAHGGQNSTARTDRVPI